MGGGLVLVPLAIRFVRVFVRRRNHTHTQDRHKVPTRPIIRPLFLQSGEQQLIRPSMSSVFSNALLPLECPHRKKQNDDRPDSQREQRRAWEGGSVGERGL